MAYLVLVIEAPSQTIEQLNDKVQRADGHEGVRLCANYLVGALAGVNDISVEVTTRDSDVSVSTSGTGSQQNTHNLK